MNKMFGVTFDPGDGPAALFVIEAEDSGEARERVLAHLHAIDMDAVTRFDLTVQDLGRPAEVYAIDENNKVTTIKEDA